jgi:hypothetical protein
MAGILNLARCSSESLESPISQEPPNPRLQRTRAARSPLSRKPFGLGIFSGRRIVTLAILAVVLVSEASNASESLSLTDQATDATVVVLARLAKRYSWSKTVLVCVDFSDPEDLLLDRVSQISMVCLKPCHFGVSDPRNRGGVIDPVTGDPAVTIGVRSIKKIGEDEFDMEGGYACGFLCAAEFQFRVRKDANGWRIVSENMLWIS